MDIARRVSDHRWDIDPIVRSVIDTDFYKLLMLQMIWKHHRDAPVTFALTNRTASARLAEIIDEGGLRAQLDHVRSLKLTRGESTWLRGNTFYGKRNIFESEFIDWLENYRFPEYELIADRASGQYRIRFSGGWAAVSLWEIPLLTILSELRSRALIRSLGRFELDVLYSRAKSKVWEKISKLKALKNLAIADFGTRRRHGFLWQDWCVEAMKEGLDSRFLGTSNALIAMRRDLEAIGTNAHELPMVYAALAGTDDELRAAPYKVLEDWARMYDGNLLIVLPDTFGTEAFLKSAPKFLAKWTGFRVDSKTPEAGGREIIAWWKAQGVDPAKKLLLFSDGLDVGHGGDNDIVKIHSEFQGRSRVGFGWGTLLTNDFTGCAPNGENLDPISLVCKVESAGGRPAVKLSDNPEKASGPRDEVERYLRVFGKAGRKRQPVLV